MRNPLSSAFMSALALSGVASATEVISLANFTPRIDNLPSSCSAAYTAQIEGCQASDFDKNARCSAQCVEGLVKIAETVTRQCANVDVPETSIIGVFMLGAGVPAVCPGVRVTTIGKSSTQAPAPSSTTESEAAPSTTAESSAAEETSAAETSAAETSSAAATDSASSASSTSSTEEEMSTTTVSAQPSTTSATQPQITFDTSAAALPPAPTTTASSQKSNQDSGGGSPFDVQAGSSSSPLRLGRFAATAMLGLAVFYASVL